MPTVGSGTLRRRAGRLSCAAGQAGRCSLLDSGPLVARARPIAPEMPMVVEATVLLRSTRPPRP